GGGGGGGGGGRGRRRRRAARSSAGRSRGRPCTTAPAAARRGAGRRSGSSLSRVASPARGRASLVTERLDRIEARRLPGGVPAEHDPDRRRDGERRRARAGRRLGPPMTPRLSP